jgi:Ca2+-binding RTX toxin-like protein
LYTTSAGGSYSTNGDFNTIAYSSKTTDGAKTFASYFNTAALIGVATTWNFSANSEYIYLSPFDLLQRNTLTFQSSWLGIHSFENDIINLGAGSDYLSFGLDFFGSAYGSTTSTATATFREASDFVLNGGYKITVNAGTGNDTIDIEYYNGDYIVNRKDTPATTIVIPVAIVNGDAGNDSIIIQGVATYVHGDSAAATTAGGSDYIEGDSFSDRIFGGPGADVIIAGGQGLYTTNPTFYSRALIQKDVLTGGLGKDNFVIDNYNSYGLNGANDFALITDFEAADRISSVFFRGDLLLEGTDGSLSVSTLGSNGLYSAVSYAYTARVFLDTDGNNLLSTAADELLVYVCGAQPTATNFIYGV